MSHSLAELVGQVQRSAGSIGAASVEIAHGNHDLSNRTEATAANLQRASSTLDRLNSAVGQSAASAARPTRWRLRPTPWRKAAVSR